MVREGGTYAFDFAVATTVPTGNSIALEVDGVPQGTVNVPNTTAWDKYQVVTLPSTPALSRGPHVVRLIFEGPGFGLDYFETRKLP